MARFKPLALPLLFAATLLLLLLAGGAWAQQQEAEQAAATEDAGAGRRSFACGAPLSTSLSLSPPLSPANANASTAPLSAREGACLHPRCSQAQLGSAQHPHDTRQTAAPPLPIVAAASASATNSSRVVFPPPALLGTPVKFVPLTEGSGTFVDDLSGEVAGKINTTTAR